MVSDKAFGTLTSSSLPFDLIQEILSRLPVKSLLQFRCVCKSWKSLISDPEFTNKHRGLSTTHSLHCISYSDEQVLLKSYSLDSVLTNITKTKFLSSNSNVFFIGSCNVILCIVRESINLLLVQLWNPSIRKFKELPPISVQRQFSMMYGFGYDPISDNYKVVVVLRDFYIEDFIKVDFSKYEVKVYTLGTDSWKSVSEFPFAIVTAQLSGQYVSGTVNWLVFTGIKRFIASFDLGNECYQEVLLPDDWGEVDDTGEEAVYTLRLSVFKDCLCMISGENVWIMKEYGNKESWTKLFTISCMRDPFASSHRYISPICVFEDEQVLLMYEGGKRSEHISYNHKNDTSKFIDLENIPEVCVESLISPYF